MTTQKDKFLFDKIFKRKSHIPKHRYSQLVANQKKSKKNSYPRAKKSINIGNNYEVELPLES